MRTRQFLSVVVLCCVASTAAARQSRVERKLVTIKAALMSADYRADLPELAALRARAAQLSDDRKLGYLADYWSGFASWRIVINGANAKMSPEEMKANLERAAADFESSARKKADFADSYVGAAAVHGWLGWIQRKDEAVRNQEYDTFQRFVKRALELEPSNPRALWIEAIPLMVLPPERGGNREHGMELYRQMVENAAPLRPQSPLPDWGKLEGLMSLAYSHLNAPSPNVNAAEEEARAALRLQPDWHYVRDILMPQIEARRKQLEEQRQTGGKQ